MNWCLNSSSAAKTGGFFSFFMIIDYSFTIRLGPPYFRSGNYNVVLNFYLQNSEYSLFLVIYF